MEDEDNQDVFVDLKNFNCKRCGQFPQDMTIYTCQNTINRKECGFNYCSSCAKNLIKCCNYKCGAGKEKILENHSVSRLLKNAKKLNTCTFCGGNFETEEDLKNHISSCSGAKYACKFCDFCEADMEKFWQHMINKHKSDVVKALDENNN